jgi:GTP-binding protein
MVLIDTAGIRRRGRIAPGVEKFSSLRAIQAIERCNVAVLVVDAEDLMTAQDAHIAGYVSEAYRGLVVAVNKWDLAAGMGMGSRYAMKDVQRRLHWAPYVPVCLVSATTGEGVTELMDTALEVFRERGTMVPMGDLNQVLLEAVAKHAPPSHGRRHLRFSRVAQTGAHPPTFTFYVNFPEMVHFSYRRYLQNALRSAFGFKGSMLRLRFEIGTKARR